MSRQIENCQWHHKTKPRLHSLVALPEFSHQIRKRMYIERGFNSGKNSLHFNNL